MKTMIQKETQNQGWIQKWGKLEGKDNAHDLAGVQLSEEGHGDPTNI